MRVWRSNQWYRRAAAASQALNDLRTSRSLGVRTSVEVLPRRGDYCVFHSIEFEQVCRDKIAQK